MDVVAHLKGSTDSLLLGKRPNACDKLDSRAWQGGAHAMVARRRQGRGCAPVHVAHPRRRSPSEWWRTYVASLAPSLSLSLSLPLPSGDRSL